MYLPLKTYSLAHHAAPLVNSGTCCPYGFRYVIPGYKSTRRANEVKRSLKRQHATATRPRRYVTLDGTARKELLLELPFRMPLLRPSTRCCRLYLLSPMVG